MKLVLLHSDNKCLSSNMTIPPEYRKGRMVAVISVHPPNCVHFLAIVVTKCSMQLIMFLSHHLFNSFSTWEIILKSEWETVLFYLERERERLRDNISPPFS